MSNTEASSNIPSLADIKASQDAMPDEVLDFVDEQAVTMKDQPVEFVGRKTELSGLENRIVRAIQSTTGVAQVTAEMIIAAPGAGKTSLMVELANRLRRNEVAVVEAHPEDLTDPKRFSDIIRKTPPWSDYVGIEDIGTKTVARFEDALQGAVETADVDLIDRVVDAWRNDSTPDIEDSLRVLDYGRAEGCVVMLDEAQLLRNDTQGKAGVPALCAAKILRTLSEPNERSHLGIHRAALLLAGLPDTKAMAEHLGAPEITARTLTPLPPTDIETVIRNAIQVGARGNEELQKRAARTWMPLILARYAEWTRIAQAGADATRIVLTEYSERCLDAPWGLGAMITVADNGRRKVYQAAKKQVLPLLKDIVAYGLLCNGNKINAESMRKLLEECSVLQHPAISGSELDEYCEESKLQLLRAGIVDTTAHLPGRRGQTSYYCPIPSLVRHISNQIESDQDIIHETLTAAGLSTERPKPGDRPFLPTCRKRPDVTEDEDE